jgi:uncharacterized membrane protein YfcA
MELELLGLILLGFTIGAYGTIIGLGGGFVLVPILLFIYPGEDPERITAVSLAVVFANTTSGSIAYGRQRRIDFLTGFIFAACAAPGVILGVFLVHVVPQRLFVLLFGSLLLVLAFISLRGAPQLIREPLRGPGVLRRSIALPEGTYVYAYRVWQGGAISAAAGVLSSLLGIGGGAIHVPAMVMWLHFPVQIAVATSQFILMFMTGGATIIHLGAGNLGGEQLIRAVAVGIGAIPGAQLGAYIARRLRSRVTLFLLGASLIGLAARLLFRGVFGI